MSRLLRYFNILAALALIVVFVAVYWYAVRPLAKTAGTVDAPLSANAEAARDALGIPHIKATSIEDAFFVQGYAAAQDRLWQMDLMRRIANGDVAELLGPAALESDRDARRLRIRRIAEDAVTRLPAEERAIFAAYARGVNHFIDTNLHRLPLEFTLLRYQPRPWTVADSLAVGLQMFRTLTSRWRDEIQKRTVRAAGDPAKVEFLYPTRSERDVLPGSNAWALTGVRTATGRPILAADMHLDASVPSVWHLVHIEAPGLNVTGFSLPGLPAVVAGHNDRIAWSCTNLGFDVQDLVAIQIDERTGRYAFRGQVEQARLEREIIRVRNARPLEVLIWVTAHGPLFLAEGNERFALRWTGSEIGSAGVPFLQLNRARNWSEFRSALERFPGPAQNFVYADVDGNIGFQAAGKLPVRNYAGDVPGNDAGEWKGFIPFNELPSAFNPASGMIVSANQNPFSEPYPYPVSGAFAPHYRYAQIRTLLTGRNGWKTGDMLKVQMDVYSAFDHGLARAAVAAFDRRKPASPRLPGAIAILRAWNGQMEIDQAAPLLTTLLFQHLRRAVAEAAAPRHGGAYDSSMSRSVIERLLRERPSGWVKDWDETLLRALDEAAGEADRMQGREPSRWNYGNSQSLHVRHPVGSGVPWFIAQPLKFWWIFTPWRAYDNYLFDIGPAPISGSPTTVKAVSQHSIPSMRMIVDLADLDRSLVSIPGGESGQILSPHYKDQWEGHYYGSAYPMQFRNVKHERRLVFSVGK